MVFDKPCVQLDTEPDVKVIGVFFLDFKRY